MSLSGGGQLMLALEYEQQVRIVPPALWLYGIVAPPATALPYTSRNFHAWWEPIVDF